MDKPTTEPVREAPAPLDFIRTIVADDVKAGKLGGRVATRFPPEPNGYLHIGHAKSICLNFGVAAEFGGTCNLRFDDTNPTKEDVEYVDSIQEDVRWLGFTWHEQPLYASDYFERLYEYARHLIGKGLAYVDSLTADEIRAHRGTLTEPGTASPYRDRPIEESLDLFARMRAGEFPDGALVLRAKIDMASPNINLRDPVLYRIRRAHHHRTGDAWCIYPMYDFAHPPSDALEHITHSLCTLEFEDHRPLYDWLIEHLPVPSQAEADRVRAAESHLYGDEQAPAAGARRGASRLGLGRPADADDCRDAPPRLHAGGDPRVLRSHRRRQAREHGRCRAPRARRARGSESPCPARDGRPRSAAGGDRELPGKYADDQHEDFEVANNPEDDAAGTRRVPFSRVLYIERDDFREEPPKKFFRLAPGREVRLRGAYFITCTGVVKDPVSGEIVELRCTYDPATRGGDAIDGRKVKATLHWVSAAHAVGVEVRLYDRLFTSENPGAIADYRSVLNPKSLEVLTTCWLEPSVTGAPAGTTYQFERLGYFSVDPDSTAGRLVFNRTVTLKDTWARIEQRG